MRISEDKAEALRRRIKILLSEAGLCESDLADEVVPLLSKPTTYRLLSAGQCFTEEHVEIILHGLRNLVGFDAPDRKVELEPSTASPPPSWLTLCRSARIDGEEHKLIEAALSDATAHSRTMWHFGTVLPTILLEEEVAERVSVYQARHFARDVDRASTFLRENASVAREGFMNFNGYRGVSEINVVTSLSGLIRMARKLSPFGDIAPDHIDASFASLISDAILEPDRNVSLLVLNDMVPGPARQWIWEHDVFASITWFDSGIAIRRRHRTCVCRVLNASDSQAAPIYSTLNAHDLRKPKGLFAMGANAKTWPIF